VAELFATGRVVDLILVLMAAEGALLMVLRARTGRGLAPADLALNLLAGACLLLALRAALVGAGWGWVALGLAAALPAHLIDLRRRLAASARQDGVAPDRARPSRLNAAFSRRP
jgi:hypothetical protein